MDSTENERMSIALSTHLDRAITGTQEEVDIRRRLEVLKECIQNDSYLNYHSFYGGSRGEGLSLQGSDLDIMMIAETVTVMYPGQFIPPSMANNTILYMRDADCRTGYVHLQLGQRGQKCSIELRDSLVRIKDSFFVSSDIFRESFVRKLTDGLSCSAWKSNGPSSSMGEQIDVVQSFPCNCWPKEANEWITRTRLYGWPHQTLIDNIVHSGCHLVPVGDKCSEDTFLQWRISFATAERSLVHSFSHIQLKVYALLKCFLKQIKVTLKETIGDDDILCSYFLKTILFHAIENSRQLFWQEKHLFYCFWFCFNILIAWVRAGVCPNYFIPANNMFQRKVHGQHQQILLDVLKNFCQLKWMCLSVTKICNPSIWETLVCPQTEQEMIFRQDIETAQAIKGICITQTGTLGIIRKAIRLLSKSQSDFDEVFTYQYSMICLQNIAAEQVSQDHYAMDNKTRYKSLRKCKNWMIHGASMGTELLRLATFNFLVGNFIKSLEMCKQVMKMASCFIGQEVSREEREKLFRHKYSQSGHTSERLQKIYAHFIILSCKDLYLPHLSLEMANRYRLLVIPPLPYAIFLSFLCCHELRDTRGRDAALRNMVDVQYDENQGGHKYWIVNTLLGICYEILGDSQMAIRAYWNSAQRNWNLEFLLWNTAIKRIAVVYLCMYASQKFKQRINEMY
ncbi:uncharacterized protein LOC110456527 [Mizuhopecten yessoensis]|uniref:uncharacterized protein LOC110456527 n=1 Tax=Mizuhopecten yessoensis TaxID=6573 RepID=UPI000B45CFDA|nr:uncharacterized protein LOC110456527 [Mizuhopecten yessoensis]